MILIAALLVAAGAVAVATPAALSRIDFSAAPAIGMAAWLGAFAAALGYVALALIALAWPGYPPGETFVGSALTCLGALEPIVVTWTAGLVAPVTAIGFTAPTGQLARIALGHRERGAALRRKHNELVEVLGRADTARADLVWLEHPVPLAYSVAGRGGYVVVTDGLARCLTEAQWRAVLAHEHAHLRGFHHQILGVCQVFARAFPWIPLFAAAPAAMATLIELAADRAAAAEAGPQALAAALRTVASRTTTALDLVDKSLELRLQCLSAPPESRAAGRRRAPPGAAGRCSWSSGRFCWLPQSRSSPSDRSPRSPI
ncbi:M56 family metallopeptidase [Nocardia sp. CA-136227]|uniref:M56 family metallopeptidase n=1 Tax=Nocardia sp. CA-136227 TaxID=3239979 RepID=UPI003D97B2F3